MNDHDRFLELGAAAAFDLLDDAGHRELEAHLAGCEACRAACLEMEEALVALAAAAPPARPAPGLRERMLAQGRTFVAALAVLGFWRRAQSDTGLRAALHPLRADAAGTPDAVVEMAAGAGFTFTREDLAGVAAASAFWHRAQSDPALQAALAAQDADAVQLGRAAGYRFAPEHLAAVTAGTRGARDELSDAELDQVAAAGTPLPTLAALGDVIGRGFQD